MTLLSTLVPPGVPALLQGRHVEAVLGINKTTREFLTRKKFLRTTPRSPRAWCVYRAVDVAEFATEFNLELNWDAILP